MKEIGGVIAMRGNGLTVDTGGRRSAGGGICAVKDGGSGGAAVAVGTKRRGG